jgi:hypothetical protein
MNVWENKIVPNLARAVFSGHVMITIKRRDDEKYGRYEL